MKAEINQRWQKRGVGLFPNDKRESMAITRALVLIIVFCGVVSGQSPCRYWRSRVDVSVHITTLAEIIDEKDPDNLIPAIECLLELEGNKNMAAFGVDPNPRLTPSGQSGGPVSIFYSPITVEVAALYFISYLYYQKWDHAGWAVLVDRDDSREVTSSDENVRKAYKHYRAWFEQLKSVGIARARDLKMEPLKGKDVWWR